MPEPRRGLELSGSLGRSQSLERNRAAVTLTRSLLRCRVGDFPLVIDLRDLKNVESRDVSAERPDLAIDLRQVFGTPSDQQGRVLLVRRLTGETVELTVDAGVELVSVDLTELFTFPALLHAQPLLRCLCGVVRLADELHYLFDPRQLIDWFLAREAEQDSEFESGSVGDPEGAGGRG